MTSTAQLKIVRLELARTDGFPEGSDRHGYVFTAPLTADGALAPELWRDKKDKCIVTRFWGDEPQKHGQLRHVGQGWRFDYDRDDDRDDEPFFKLDRHRLTPGSYVSVTESDGAMWPFRVVSVT